DGLHQGSNCSWRDGSNGWLIVQVMLEMFGSLGAPVFVQPRQPFPKVFPVCYLRQKRVLQRREGWLLGRLPHYDAEQDFEKLQPAQVRARLLFRIAVPLMHE